MQEWQGRQTPEVQKWIAAFRDEFGEHNEDCLRCGYPHNPRMLCGSGSIFGLMKVCGHNYGIDVGNARFFYDFSKDYIPEGSVFLGNMYFHSSGNNVIITSYRSHNNTPQKKEVSIPKDSWNKMSCL